MRALSLLGFTFLALTVFAQDLMVIERSKFSYKLSQKEVKWIVAEYKHLQKNNLEVQAGNAREIDKLQWAAIDNFFGNYDFYEDRKKYLSDITGYNKLTLLAALQKQKLAVQGICQVNQKKLLDLYEQESLAKTKFYLQMMDYLSQETDKRCRGTWMKYVDIKNQLKSRSEENSGAQGFIKTKSEKVP